MNRKERRRRVFAGPRPNAELIVTTLDTMPFVLVGFAGDGYVRLDAGEARELAATLMALAETLD